MISLSWNNFITVGRGGARGCQGGPLPPKNFAGPPQWPSQNQVSFCRSLSESPTQTIDSSPCCKTGPSSAPPQMKMSGSAPDCGLSIICSSDVANRPTHLSSHDSTSGLVRVESESFENRLESQSSVDLVESNHVNSQVTLSHQLPSSSQCQFRQNQTCIPIFLLFLLPAQIKFFFQQGLRDFQKMTRVERKTL